MLPTEREPAVVVEGDALDVLRRLPSAAFDAVITDPPYPCIKREYGTWTEAEWFALMNPVVEECRRVLKPQGSAVFIIQPNSERVGRMRTWWLRFMLDWAERWGMVQDAWWWNPSVLPNGGACSGGLMRNSVKAAAWFGPHDCYRDQDAALWEPNWDRISSHAMSRAAGRQRMPSGNSVNYQRVAETVTRRGGATPFNLLPFANANSTTSAGASGHGAGTPLALARWWVRYICPPGGLILDPFVGSGTMAVGAMAEGRRCLGIERIPKYVDIARRRIAAARAESPLFARAP